MGLYVMGLVIAGLFVLAGVLSQPVDAWCLLAGLAVLGWLVAIRCRYRVRVSDEELQARNLLRESRMRWQDVIRVVPATEGGYWTSRLFGPSVLEFASPSSRLRVNFKLFPAECLVDVMQHVPPGARVAE